MTSAAWFATLSSLFVAAFASCAFYSASRKVGKSPWPIALYLAWIIMIAILAKSGFLEDFDSTPPRAMFVLLPGILFSIAFASSAWGTRLLDRFSLEGLILFQSFRFLPEILILLGFREGIIPVQLTLHGRNWDVLTAILAIVAYFLIRRGFHSRAIATAWSVVGIGLLVNIVGMAILSMPTSFQVFHNEPANTFVARFPYIWLPGIHVTAAIAGHALVIRKLLSIK